MLLINKILPLIHMLSMSTMLSVSSSVTSIGTNSNDNELILGRFAYDKMFVKSDGSRDLRRDIDILRASYSKIMLLFAVSFYTLMKYNVYSRSNILVQESKKVINKRIVNFYFILRIMNYFNEILMKQCYRYSLNSASSENLILQSGEGIGVNR